MIFSFNFQRTFKNKKKGRTIHFKKKFFKKLPFSYLVQSPFKNKKKVRKINFKKKYVSKITFFILSPRNL